MWVIVMHISKQIIIMQRNYEMMKCEKCKMKSAKWRKTFFGLSCE